MDETTQTMHMATSTASTALQESKFDWFVTEEKILISISPEKVGMVFKHTNYVVQLESRNSSTLRRYSDFIWLLDILIKKYPYRILPNLPPKKVGPDEIFLEQRRRALSRFLNFIYNHPILRTDDTVLAFLTVDSDIQTYRKSVSVTVDEEYITADITDAMLARIPDNFDEVINKFKKNILELTDYYRAFASLMEKIVRRIDANSMDFMTYCNLLKKVPDCNDCTKIECFKCSSLSIGCGRLADSLSDASKVFEKQAENVYDGAIEGLKAFRDLLVAVQDLLSRREKALQQINIETLQKRITATQEKIRNDTYTQKEVDKLIFQVEQDQKEILLCIKKQKFIRYCTWFELQFYHRKKITISTLYQSFAAEQSRCQAEFSDIWKSFADSAKELPTFGF